MSTAVLAARNLSVHFGGPRGYPAVLDVTLELFAGETLGLVGESGSGKTTLARALLGMVVPSGGDVLFDGAALPWKGSQKARRALGAVQYVHQDAAASLDPWWTVGASLGEALRLGGIGDRAAVGDKVAALLAEVGLDGALAGRHVHELSGGQARRVALARVLAVRPRVIILDEPTAGLDMSVQATVLGMLSELRDRLGLSYILISHDLGLVRRLCERIAILYAGRVVEVAPAGRLFAAPGHPYTRELLAASLGLGASPALASVSTSEPPALSRAAALAGCAFRNRCPYADARCGAAVPPLETREDGRSVACWHLPSRAGAA